ncbi:YdcF family protein [Waterburya agarophytonicola K14]|uniref:YdcF family protein n=1 Tax=Waterburya agarophytonicola KI4 TaxID=2874699 RepID=A0A964FGJ8_9CYAN|nr:YdcF family protein [Waterburya agarophytonicola]MCC0176699.1 YdcF family protein [Waterburya agarophytonicola KI4]
MSFLFLSKLLPLFIYPLGFSCILLLVALWFCFKRSRWTFIPVLLAFIVLMTASNVQFSNSLVTSLERQYLPQEKTPQADAIVVLGGATRNDESPRIMPDMSERGDRLLYGVKLYKDGAAPYILLTGGRIEWYGGESSEAESMATIMEIMGVPRDAMLLESRSLTTYENALYSKEILDRRNLKKILLVTSAAHMPRSMAIFKKQGIDAIPAPADFLVSDRNLIESKTSAQSRIISLFPNPESLDRTTQILKEYIGTFIYRLKGWL